jgi:hypothetical protein
MNIKKFFIMVIGNLICAAGGTLITVGAFSSIWCLFVSSDESRFYWGGGALILAYIGHVIYSYAFPYIRNKWDDYY